MKSATPLLLSLALLSAPALAQEAATPPAAEAATAETPAAEAPAAEAPAAAVPAAEAPLAEAAATEAQAVEATAVEAPTAAPASDAVAAPAPATADGASASKVEATIGKPADGKAMVVFFRPGKFLGAAVGFKVREKGVELGKLRNSNWFAIEVDPGAHEYVVHSEAKDVTNIEAEAGETYFLSGSIGMGVLAGHPNLSPSDAAAFQAALPKLKPSKPLN